MRKSNSDFRLDVLDVILNSGIITGKELAKSFGHKDTRTVRLAIQQLRLEGFPICISPNGYYYSEDKDDIEKTINEYIKKIDEMLIICERLRSAIQ